MQTKLTKQEKRYVRDMIADFESTGGQLFSFPEEGLTIAMIPAFAGSRMAHVGVSWQAPSEKKFRRLVGADTAIARCNGSFQFFQVPISPGFYTAWAWEFAKACESVKPIPPAQTGPFPSGDPHSLESCEKMLEMRERMQGVAESL